MTNGTAIEPFNFNNHPVRVVMLGDEPWFVAADVCAVLGIRNVPDAMTRLDEADIAQTDVRSGGQNRRMYAINEPGLYELVIRSDKPDARAFRRWITAEVLPAIRKTGAYVTPALDPLDALQVMIDRMREQRDHLAQHDRAILELGARTERLEAGYERLAATGFANLRGLRHDVSYLNRLGRAAANIARRDGVPIEKAHSTIFGTVNAWPVEVWDEALHQVGG